MDIGLPRLDGIAATQQIKAALPNVRVVVLTSTPQKQKSLLPSLAVPMPTASRVLV
jgi:DNA-binding NarL/FixJ family response regulator